MKPKIILIIIVFLFIDSIGLAQYIPLLQNNANWNEYYSFESVYHYSYTVTGDSLFQGIVYKKVLYACPTWSMIILMREDSTEKKVYETDYYGNETMIYNFNLSIGDTFSIGSQQYILISISDTLPTYCCLNDTVYCALSPLIVYRFHDLSFPSSIIAWVEGIGSLSGLRRSMADWCQDTKLICHFDSNQTWNYYFKSWNQISPCQLPVSVSSAHEKSELRIFPNPSFDHYICIEGNNQIKSIIYNLLGQPLNEYSLSKENQSRIYIDLPAGVYLLEIHTLDGLKILKKIVLN